jgi:hypothetical protein
MHDTASLQAKVSRLRQIIADSIPTPAAEPSDEADAWRRYQHYAANQAMPAVDATPIARKLRTINRIAVCYGWVSELQRMLDFYDASSLTALDHEQVDAVHERMTTLESCLQDGCDPPDIPHAR